jgi:hypothetical protein
MPDQPISYRDDAFSRGRRDRGRDARPAGARRGGLLRAIPLAALTRRSDIMVQRAVARLRDTR